MAKTDTITVRLDPVVKKGAEAVLKMLGLTVTQAVTIFFVQISLRKGLPFPIEIPKDGMPIDNGNLSILDSGSSKDDLRK